jgi:DNA polymerase-3 subunit alpha
LGANEESGTNDLFGGKTAPVLDIKPVRPWTPMERLQHEFASVGFYLSGHPLDAYEKVLAKLGVRRFAEFEAATSRGATAGRLAGIVLSARERRSQRGNKFAFAMFSDTSGQFEAVIFSDTLAAARDFLDPGTPVLLNVEAERDGDTVKMRVQSLEPLERAAAQIERGLKLVMDPAVVASRRANIAELRTLLKPGGAAGRKGGEVRLVMALGDRAREIEITLPGRYDVTPAQAGHLSTVPGVLEVVET